MSKEWRRDPSAGDITGGWKPLEDRLRRLSARLDALANGAYSEFVTTGPNGIRIKQGAGLRVDDGGAVQSGDFEPGEAGWQLKEDSAEFNNLTLRGGIIGNDALSQPVVPGVANQASSGFPVTTTFSEVTGVTATVPAGVSRLLATVSGWVFARNPNTSGGADGTGTDALWCLVRVGSHGDSHTFGHGISGSNGFTTATAGVSVLATDLVPGDPLRLSVFAGSSFATLATNPNNRATISAALSWLR